MLGSELFLKKYCKEIQQRVSDRFNALTIFEMLFNEDIKSSTSYDYDEIISKTKLIKTLLDKVSGIVSKPLIKTDVEEVIIRSELSERLSPNSFLQTLRDPRLWKLKDGKPSPEYVKNEVSIDTVSTYENAFIAHLIDLLSKEVSSLINEINPLVESLEEKYETKGMTYGRHSILRELSKDYPYEKEFEVEESNSYEVLAILKRIEKRIIYLKSTENYRLFKLFPFKGEIIPTNILIHNQSYNYCFKYYLENYQNNFKSNSDLIEKYYYQYVLTLFLMHIYKSEYKNNFKKISLKDNDENHLLDFKETGFAGDIFSLRLIQDPDNTGFEIEVTFQKEEVTRYYFYTRYSYDDNSSNDIEYFIKKKKEIYDDVVLITMNNNKHVFENTLCISIYKEDKFYKINNLFASLTMLFFAPTEIYEHKCPVCGKKAVDYSEGHYECRECKALYNIVKINKKEALYIKTLRRR